MHPRVRIRARRRDFLRRNRRLFAVVSIPTGVVLVVVVLWSWSHSEHYGAFFAGAATIGFAWFISAIRGLHGLDSQLSGLRAEHDTSTRLRGLERRGWVVVDAVEFEGFDVDHVVVGRNGVYVVESKWSSAEWHVDSGGRLVGAHGCPDGQAARNALTVQRFLRHHAGVEVDVTPVVAAWGPCTHLLPATPVMLSSDVVVVRGVSLASWLRDAATTAIDVEDVHAMERALREFVRERARYEQRVASGGRS